VSAESNLCKTGCAHLGRATSSTADRLTEAAGHEMTKCITTCSLYLGSIGQLHSSSLESDLS